MRVRGNLKVEREPSANGCVRRVAFGGWSYVLVPTRDGAILVPGEVYQRARSSARVRGEYGRVDDNFHEVVRLRREDAARCLTVTPADAVVDASGAVVGDRGDLHSTMRRPGTLPLKRSPRDAVPCCCVGCAPVAVDDGRRPREVMLQVQESTANVVALRARRVTVESRVPPADADVPECAGCGKAVPIAIDQTCWHCLAEGYLSRNGEVYE